jgi:hypothetical protein
VRKWDKLTREMGLKGDSKMLHEAMARSWNETMHDLGYTEVVDY